MDTSTRYGDYMREWGMLDQQYISGSWQQRQQEVIDYITPYRGRFQLDEQNKQPRKDQNIVNDTATDAAKKLSAAAQMGISPPSRKWLSFTSSLPEVRDDPECKRWFDEARDVVLQLFAESNYYKVQANVYDDLITPATSLKFIEEDERDVIRAVHVPCGQYRLAVDARGRVSRTFRRLSMTVEQVVDQFCRTDRRGGRLGAPDFSRVSVRVRDAWQNRRFYDWISILHACQQRSDRQFGKIDARNMPWSSCWMEWSSAPSTQGGMGAMQQDGFPQQLLSESGFPEQPFSAPRWDVVGEDAYGSQSPAMQCIADVRAMQSLETAGGTLVATLAKPPMNVPPQLASSSLVPGARNNVEDPRIKFEPSYVPHPDAVRAADEKTQRFEQRSNRAFYGDLLFLISSDPRTQPATAEEIKAKSQERLLAMGGFYMRFSDEGMTPDINRTLAIAQRKRLLRPPPRKMLEAAMRGGRILKVDFLNSIAEAMKAQGVAPILGWVNDAVTIAKETGRGDILDKVDFDGFMTMTADLRGVPAKLVVPDEVVQQQRQARAQAQQKQAEVEQQVQQAKAYKDLSQSDPEQMQQIYRQFGPAAEAQATTAGV